MKVSAYTKKIVDLEITGATLLSIEEAEQLPERLRRYGGFWWLRSPGNDSNRAANVSYSGYFCSRDVDYEFYKVRPALKINLKSSTLKIGDIFKFGDRMFEIISDDLAFCLTDIGMHCFREKWEANDANNYEKSDIKKYIDNWFDCCKEVKE